MLSVMSMVSASSLDVILSFHCYSLDTPSMDLMQLLWKPLILLTLSAFTVHVSAPYSRVGNTTALYTSRFVAMLSFLLWKIADRRQAKALDALRSLILTSPRTSPSLMILLPNR